MTFAVPDPVIGFALERAWELVVLLRQKSENTDKRWAREVVSAFREIEPNQLSHAELGNLRHALTDDAFLQAFDVSALDMSSFIAVIDQYILEAITPNRSEMVLKTLWTALASTLDHTEAIAFLTTVKTERSVEELRSVMVSLADLPRLVKRVSDSLTAAIREIERQLAVKLPLKMVVVPSPIQHTPASFVMPRFVMIEYHGRTDDLDRLYSWANGRRMIEVALITGKPGSGKTRMAIELARRLQGDGWAAGMVSANADRSEILALAKWERPTLACIDDAEARTAQVLELLDAQAAADNDMPLRILLTSRATPQYLIQHLTRVEEGARLVDGMLSIDLDSEQLSSHELREIYRATRLAATDHGFVLRADEPTVRFGDTPLTASLTAFGSQLSFTESIRQVLDKEIDTLRSSANADGISLSNYEMRRLVAAYTLSTPDIKQNASLISRLLRGRHADAASIARWLRNRLDEDDDLLRPYLLAEECLREELTLDPDLAAIWWTGLGHPDARGIVRLTAVLEGDRNLQSKISTSLESPLKLSIANLLDQEHDPLHQDSLAFCFGNLIRNLPEADLGDPAEWPEVAPGVCWLRATAMVSEYNRLRDAESPDPFRTIELLMNIAGMASDARQFADALAPGHLALLMLEKCCEIQPNDYAASYLHAAFVMAIALRFTDQPLRAAAEVERALEHLRKVSAQKDLVAWAPSQNDPLIASSLAALLSELAVIYDHLGLNEQATKSQLASANLLNTPSASAKDASQLVYRTNALQALAARSATAEEALTYLNEAKVIAESASELVPRLFQSALARILQKIAEAEHSLGKPEALEHANESVRIARTIFSASSYSTAWPLAQIAFAAARINDLCGEPDNAVDCLETALSATKLSVDADELALLGIETAIQLSILRDKVGESSLGIDEIRWALDRNLDFIEQGKADQVFGSLQLLAGLYLLDLVAVRGPGGLPPVDARVCQRMDTVDLSSFGSRGQAHQHLLRARIDALQGAEPGETERHATAIAMLVLNQYGDKVISSFLLPIPGQLSGDEEP